MSYVMLSPETVLHNESILSYKGKEKRVIFIGCRVYALESADPSGVDWWAAQTSVRMY